MTIMDRMAAALDELELKWASKRRPKAFYLVAADHAEFMAIGEKDTVRVPFGNNPVIWRDEDAFHGVPVRLSGGQCSKLYNHTMQGQAL